MARIRPNDPCWCGSGVKFKRCHAPQRGPVRPGEGYGSRPFEPVRPGIVSPPRIVPPEIQRPDYVLDPGALEGPPPDPVKDAAQIERVRRACRAAALVLQTVAGHVRPGMTTDELDAIAHARCVELGGYPSPLGYRGFPKSITTSVNEVICHGIPDSRPLQEGDIVNCDVTVFLAGMHGDLSATYLVGETDEASKTLVRVARECLELGIQAARPGRPVRDIGRAIEPHAVRHGLSVVRAFVGHGVGEKFHMDPQVKHYDDPASTFVLRPGMTFTIEPMINEGTWRHVLWDDGWTAVTADRLRSAQFEHTVLITDSGAEVLTLP